MRNRILLMVTTLGLVLGGLATEASADRGGGGDFWEKMSGPGNWGGGHGFLSFCFDEDVKNLTWKNCNIRTRTGWLTLKGSYMRTGEEDREELQSPTLHVVSFEPAFDFKVHKLGGKLPVLLGFGGGVHRFFGEDVGITRFSMEPRVSIIFPIDNWYLGLRYSVKYFYKGFTAGDFGTPGGLFDTDGGDAVPTLTLFFGW